MKNNHTMEDYDFDNDGNDFDFDNDLVDDDGEDDVSDSSEASYESDSDANDQWDSDDEVMVMTGQLTKMCIDTPSSPILDDEYNALKAVPLAELLDYIRASWRAGSPSYRALSLLHAHGWCQRSAVHLHEDEIDIDEAHQCVYTPYSPNIALRCEFYTITDFRNASTKTHPVKTDLFDELAT